MRTTVEITDNQRAELLHIAAIRGEKGFSALIRDAIDRYLISETDRQARVAAAIDLRGSFDHVSADRLEKSIREMRSHWR